MYGVLCILKSSGKRIVLLHDSPQLCWLAHCALQRDACYLKFRWFDKPAELPAGFETHPVGYAFQSDREPYAVQGG